MSRSSVENGGSGKQPETTAASIALRLVIIALSAMFIALGLSQAAVAGPDASAETLTKVGADGKPTFEATVLTPPSAEQIDVEASTDLNSVVVGQQILLRVLVTGNGPLPPGRLILPSIDDTDLLILGEERRIDRSAVDITNDDDSNLSGSRGWVYERRYALFPRSAGRLKIPPAVFSAWRPGADGPEQLSSAALAIEVMPAQPPPSNAAADSAWLPAKQLSLTEAGSSLVQLAPGQVIERMLTLKALGLRAEDLPPIRAPIPFPLQVREDAPRLRNERGPDGVTGYRTERITLSSAEPGLYRLPAVTLDWWNVDAARWEQATTPLWQLQVAEFDSSSRRPAPDWRRDRGPDGPTTEQPTSPAPSSAKQPWVVSHWPWIIALLGLLLVVWQRRRLYRLIRRRGPSASS